MNLQEKKDKIKEIAIALDGEAMKHIGQVDSFNDFQCDLLLESIKLMIVEKESEKK